MKWAKLSSYNWSKWAKQPRLCTPSHEQKPFLNIQTIIPHYPERGPMDLFFVPFGRLCVFLLLKMFLKLWLRCPYRYGKIFVFAGFLLIEFSKTCFKFSFPNNDYNVIGMNTAGTKNSRFKPLPKVSKWKIEAFRPYPRGFLTI